jgi:hypothetical protein
MNQTVVTSAIPIAENVNDIYNLGKVINLRFKEMVYERKYYRQCATP